MLGKLFRYSSFGFFFALSIGHAQSQIIPQIADGGGWQTTIVLTNTAATQASIGLTFYMETGGGATQQWNLSFMEMASTQSFSLPGGSTLFLHTPGTSGTTSVGWAQLQAPAAVTAYAIFTQRVSGRQDQDGTAPAAASATRILVPFDNSPGFTTSLAVANPNGSDETISVNIEINGSTSQATLPDLPAQGHTAFALSQQIPATAGQRGLAEFYVNSGSFSIIALRFNPTGAFTAAPVYTETGPPILGGSGGGGGSTGTLPTFNTLSAQGSFSPAGSSFSDAITILGSEATGWTALVTARATAGTLVLGFDADWSGASVSGLTFTFASIKTGAASIMVDATGNISGITSGSLVVTLSPQAGVPTVGTISGTLTLVSPLATLSGPVSGSYTAQ